MKTATVILIFDFPVILGKCSIFEIGQGRPYIDETLSLKNFSSAYKSSIKEELDALVQTCDSKQCNLAAYFSGFFLELLQKTDKMQLDRIKKLVDQGRLEILGGTANHSLSSMYSPLCFEWELIAHLDTMKRVFDTAPTKFYNTENLFFDGIVPDLVKHGFDGIFAGVVQWYLGDHPENRVFKSAMDDNFSVFLIDVENQANPFEDSSVLYHLLQFDLESLQNLGGLSEVIKRITGQAEIKTLTEISNLKNKPTYKVKSPTMGSLHNRTVSSYNGEAMQKNALNQYYNLCEIIEKSQYADFMKDHIALGKSDIFLQISKSSNFNNDPFETYSKYINMLTDLMIRLGRKS